MRLSLNDFYNVLPSYARAWAPLLYAFVVALNAALDIFERLFVPQLSIGSATGVWLTLRALGYGVVRGSEESDEGVRARIRNVNAALTLNALRDALNAVLVQYTAVPAVIQEHWATPLVLSTNDLKFAAVLDNTSLFTGLAAITVTIPDFGVTHPAYFAVRNELNRLRGAGVSTTIIIEGSP